jgi:hypothetical protein
MRNKHHIQASEKGGLLAAETLFAGMNSVAVAVVRAALISVILAA